MNVVYPQLSASIAGACLIAVVAATMFHIIGRAWLRLSGAVRYRSQFASFLLHTAGHARRMELRRLDRQSGMLQATLLLLPLVFASVMLAWPGELRIDMAELRWILMLVLASGIALYFVHLLVKVVTRRRKVRYALLADMAVSHGLERVMRHGFAIFHDVPFGSHTVNKIIVGPQGVFAVTVLLHQPRRSDRRAGLTASFDGTNIVFPDGTAIQPGRAVKERASEVGRYLARKLGKDLTVCPVLVLPGWRVECTGQPAFPLVNERNVDMVTSWTRPESHLLNEEVAAIQESLHADCRDGRFLVE